MGKVYTYLKGSFGTKFQFAFSGMSAEPRETFRGSIASAENERPFSPPSRHFVQPRREKGRAVARAIDADGIGVGLAAFFITLTFVTERNGFLDDG